MVSPSGPHARGSRTDDATAGLATIATAEKRYARPRSSWPARLSGAVASPVTTRGRSVSITRAEAAS